MSRHVAYWKCQSGMVLLDPDKVALNSTLEIERLTASMEITEAKQSHVSAHADEKTKHVAWTSIGLVLLCTVIGAGAQFLFRYGTTNASEDGLLNILINWPVLVGYLGLAVNTGLLVLALRNGQLSILYPIIALTYVWVTLLSPVLFGEIINISKVVGIGLIVLGVWFIGLGSRT